jgi:hypothetical protein
MSTGRTSAVAKAGLAVIQCLLDLGVDVKTRIPVNATSRTRTSYGYESGDQVRCAAEDICELGSYIRTMIR